VSFAQKAWHDGPTGGTPITSTELNRIEQGITDATAAAETAETNAAEALAIAPDAAGATAGYVYTANGDNTASFAPAGGGGSAALSAGYLALPGSNGSYAQAPDAAGLRVAGDLDIRWYGSLGSLTGSGFQTLVMKQNTSATAWMFRETAAGKLQLSVSADGTTIPTAATCSVSTPAASGYRVTWRKSDGRVQFFNLDAAGSVVLADGSKWTQLGADQTTSTANTSLYSGGLNPPVTIGAAGNGTSVASAGTTVTKVEIRSGLDGSLVANPTFTNHTYADTSFTDASANVWTVAGFAVINPVSGTVSGNGSTLTLVSPNDSRSGKLRWGAASRHPTTGWFHVDDFGPVGVNPAAWTTAQTGAAARAARDAAVATIDKANGYGATVYFSRNLYVIDHDPTITDPYTGLNYCAVKTWDYLEFRGATRDGTMVQLAAGENCHVFGHPGRLSGDGSQDQIFNVTFTDLTVDGNKANQDGCNTHAGLHLDQHPGVMLSRVVVQNCNGMGYYNTANGEFGTGGVHAVREPVVTDCKANNNDGSGWYMSATNRATSYKGVYASSNGNPQARIVGKTPAVTLTASGNLVVQIDNNSNTTVALASGDTPSSVVTKLNAGLGSTATAALSAGTGRLLITSATVGGISKVYLQAGSDATILTNLGLTLSPSQANSDFNNYRVGANEYRGFYLDHSECHADGLFADSNYGDGFDIHNVNACHYDNLHATRNNGIGIYVDALNHSSGKGWVSMMNCVDFGAASYRAPLDSAEVYFDSGTEGYGITKDSTISVINGPGDKTTIGNNPDNRHANWSVYVADGITLTVGVDTPNATSLHIGKINPGDGGLSGVLRAPSGYVSTTYSLTRQLKTANYTAVLGDLVACDTTGGTFTVTIPAASSGKGRVVVKWVAGAVAPTVQHSGSDHFNLTTGATSFSPTLLNQGYQLESDGSSIWTITADDLPLSVLDTRYLAATTTLDAIPHPAADVSVNSHKLTNVANGTADTDGQAFGQRPFDGGKLTSTVTVTNVTGAQQLWAATTIPAAKLAVGSTFVYTVTGTLDNIATSGNFTFLTKVNGSAANSSIMPSQTSLATGVFWSLLVYVTVVATGVGGSVNVTGLLTLPTVAGGTQGQKVIGNVQAVDLSSGLTIRADVNMATANTGNTVRAQAGACAQMNMP